MILNIIIINTVILFFIIIFKKLIINCFFVATKPSENLKLIDKIVIITKAKKDENIKLLEHDKNVKFIFATELKQLLTEIGKCFIGMK